MPELYGQTMPSNQPLLFKLDQHPRSRGLRCDREGLFLIGEPLLEHDDEGRFRPRPPERLRKIFDGMYRDDADWESRIRSVKVVADALNKDDMARAMMAAVLMRLPEPGGAIRIADVDGILAKAGFNPAEARDTRGRWAAEGASGGTVDSKRTRQAFLEELSPLIEQQLEETPVEPMPPPTDIVPPILGPRRFDRNPPLSNPYPDRSECVEEWARAYKFCNELRQKGKLGKDGYRGFGWRFNQCLQGQVSQDCGGSLIWA